MSDVERAVLLAHPCAPLGTVASLMALLSGGAGAVGMFASGWLTDRLATRDPRWRMWIMAVTVGITVPSRWSNI